MSLHCLQVARKNSQIRLIKVLVTLMYLIKIILLKGLANTCINAIQANSNSYLLKTILTFFEIKKQKFFEKSKLLSLIIKVN